MNANIVKMQFFFIKSNMTSEVIQGHKNDLFDQNFAFSSVFVIDCLMKQMPLNIMKEQSLTYTKTTFALF